MEIMNNRRIFIKQFYASCLLVSNPFLVLKFTNSFITNEELDPLQIICSKSLIKEKVIFLTLCMILINVFLQAQEKDSISINWEAIHLPSCTPNTNGYVLKVEL